MHTNFNKLLEAQGLYFLCDFRSHCSSRLHRISSFNDKCTPTISERCHQRSMLPALWKMSWATKRSSKC